MQIENKKRARRNKLKKKLKKMKKQKKLTVNDKLDILLEYFGLLDDDS